MSDKFDEEFRKVVRLEDRVAAKHATLPREELVDHMHGPHHIATSTDMVEGCVSEVALETLNEPTLRMQHRRLHELGMEHR